MNRNRKYGWSKAVVKGFKLEGRREELVTVSTDTENFAALTLDCYLWGQSGAREWTLVLSFRRDILRGRMLEHNSGWGGGASSRCFPPTSWAPAAWSLHVSSEEVSGPHQMLHVEDSRGRWCCGPQLPQSPPCLSPSGPHLRNSGQPPLTLSHALNWKTTWTLIPIHLEKTSSCSSIDSWLLLFPTPNIAEPNVQSSEASFISSCHG